MDILGLDVWSAVARLARAVRPLHNLLQSLRAVATCRCLGLHPGSHLASGRCCGSNDRQQHCTSHQHATCIQNGVKEHIGAFPLRVAEDPTNLFSQNQNINPEPRKALSAGRPFREDVHAAYLAEVALAPRSGKSTSRISTRGAPATSYAAGILRARSEFRNSSSASSDSQI